MAMAEGIQFHVLLENVAGTRPEDAEDMRYEMSTKEPIHVDAKEVSWAARNRLWWLTWTLTLRKGETWASEPEEWN